MRFNSRLFYGFGLSLVYTTMLFAQNEETPKIAFGAFFDAYYAYDFERPATRERAYTTQPARHNEFNINLAFVEAKISGERVRGRFALQTGTSVNLNYAAEANNRELAQLIQEGVVGYRLAGNLWGRCRNLSFAYRIGVMDFARQLDLHALVVQRFFNDVVLKFSLSSSFQIAGMFDLGLEEKPAGSGNSKWYDAMIVGRLQASETFAFTGRFEYYADKDQVIVKTGTSNGFQIYGGSLTVDVAVAPNLLWRLEGRLLSSKDGIYPMAQFTKLSKTNTFIVTSLGLSL